MVFLLTPGPVPFSWAVYSNVSVLKNRLSMFVYYFVSQAPGRDSESGEPGNLLCKQVRLTVLVQGARTTT